MMRVGNAAILKSAAGVTACLSLCLSLAGCNQNPWFPVPEQHSSFAGFQQRSMRIVNMYDPDAGPLIVRDIGPMHREGYRWTQSRPALKIRVRTLIDVKYSIDFTLPAIVFHETGPVTIAFTVNDHVLDRVRYTEPGEKHFEKAVPPEWLTLDEEAIAGAEIDKLWTSKRDGTTFGFILTRIGLSL
jgi:hypothetical protein